jgi:hypothetical protein
LYWMSVAVGKKHDEKHGYSRIDARTERGT